MAQAKKVTAKVKLSSREPQGTNLNALRFEPDYQDDRNKEWAAATPHLQLNMTVNGEVVDFFEPGAYTLTFEKNKD